MDLNDSLIGERWAMGSALFEVTGPRIPCRVFAGFWQEPDLVRQFVDRGHTGAFLRVCEEGPVAAGDPIRVRYRPSHGVTVGTVFRALTKEPDLVGHLCDVAHMLPGDMRRMVLRRASRTPAAQ